MDPQAVANVLSLQQAVDNLITEVTADPEMLSQPSEDFARVVSTVKRLCRFDSIQVGSEGADVTESFGGSAQPFRKMPRLSSVSGGGGGPGVDYSNDSRGGFRGGPRGGFRGGFRGGYGAESRDNFSPRFSGNYNRGRGFGYGNGGGSSYGNTGSYGSSGGYGNRGSGGGYGSYGGGNRGGYSAGSYEGGEGYNGGGWGGGRGRSRGYRGSVW